MIELETGLEVFFFLIFIFLSIYAIFIGIVCAVEYILYQKERKKSDEKFKH